MTGEVRAGGVRLPVAAGLPETTAPVSGWVVVPRQAGLPANQPLPLSPAEAALLDSLHRVGLATLSVDLLTPAEAASPEAGFNTALLGARLTAVTRWLSAQAEGRGRRVGYVAAGQAAGAALWAAAELRTEVAGVVALGGRVDLAVRRLAEVVAPVMLVVNRNDRLVLGANRAAHQALNPASRLVVAPSFRYLRYWLSEPAGLDRMLAREWLAQHVLGQTLAPDRPRLTDWLPSLNLRGQAMATATVVALLASLAGPPGVAEAASTVSVSGFILTYTADAGQSNNLTVDYFNSPFFPNEAGYYISDANNAVAAGTGCDQIDSQTVLCVASSWIEFNFNSLVINAGDLNDTLTLAASGDVVALNGAAGADVFNVKATGTNATVNTGTGNDTINLGSNAPAIDGVLSELEGTLHIQGGDSDVLNLGDKGSTHTTSHVFALGGAGARTIEASGLYSIVIDASASPLGGGVNFWSGIGQETSFVHSTRSGEKLTIAGHNFDLQYDRVSIGHLGQTAQNIQGLLHISNPAEYTMVDIDNRFDTTARTVTFNAASPATLSGLAPANITFTRADMHSVEAHLGTGADTVTIDDSWTNGVPGGQVPRRIYGGDGGDYFIATTDASTNGGLVHGENHNDTVSYELWSTGVNINVTAPTLPGFGAIAAIDNAVGGSGNDVLTGRPNQPNTLNGGPGTDTVSDAGDVNFYLFNNRLERWVGPAAETDALINIEAAYLVGGDASQVMDAYSQDTKHTTLLGGGGNDVLVGGALTDSVVGGGGNDNVMGSWGNDTLVGGTGEDTLREENNFANLQLFSTSMTGSAGTDTLTQDFEAVHIIGGNSANLIDLSQWNQTPAALWGNGGNDTLRLGGGDYNDHIDGGSEFDRVEQVGVSSAFAFPFGGGWQFLTIDSGGNANGTDMLFGIDGIVLTGTTSADVLNVLGFTGPVSLYGLGGNDLIIGGQQNDFLDGGSGDDAIDGNEGDDTLSGGLGNDTVDGGDNNDTMRLDMGNNSVTLSGNTITGDGTDEVSNVENLIVVGAEGANNFDAGAYGGVVSMYGNGGNDTLVAGTGGGSLDGGGGTDRVVAANASTMTLSNSQLLKGGATFALAGIDEGSLQGSSSGDSLNAAAFSGPTTLEGLAGNDTLVGGSNADSLIGGENNDALTGNNGNDTLDGGGGTDTLQGDGGNDSLLGGADDDVLLGNLGNNTLKGDAGNDSLVGDSGNDSLLGGSEDDTLTGGLGTNTLDGGAGTLDRVVESLAALAGTRALTLTDSSLTLSGVPTSTTSLADIELAHITGSNQADTLDASGFNGQVTLIGGSGDDELSGGAGSDSLDGSAGSDSAVFKVSGDVTLTGTALEGQGNDTLVNIERFRIVGGPASQRLDASGFLPPSGTDGVTMDGGGGSDTLIGSAYRDSLFGNTGNDVLIGNGEADTLDGGADNGDVVSATGAGPFSLTDTSLVTEGVTDVLTSTEGAIITGSLAADVFDAWGFTGRVTLVGEAGNDEMRIATGGGSLLGGLGNDSLRVVGDTDFDLTNGQLEMLGQAFVLSSTESVSITAGVSANSLDASTYSGNVTLMGVGGDDELKGGLGNDVILGGDGDDIMGGGPGADTQDGGAHGTADTWVETGPVSVTLVALGVPSLPIDVVTGLELAIFTGDASPNIFNLIGFTGTATLKGGAGNDFLTGGNMPDLVQGEDGNDTLTGNAALDTLDGGGGNDRLVAFGDAQFDLSDERLEGEGTGTDTLASIDEAVLTGFGGSSVFDASAFGGPTTLIGGDGPDTLIGGKVGDSLIGDGGDDHLEGREGNDILTGLEGHDFLDGGVGNDLVSGYLGNDTLRGDEGNDTLIGAEGSDSMVGGGGDDLLSHAFDILTTTVGLSMDDTLRGGPGLDTLQGGVGFDLVEEIGDANYLLTNASLQGEMGNDVLSNFEAANLTGGDSPNLFNTLAFTGPVTLSGLGGSDTFLSGAQSDSVIGGAGSGDQVQASGNFTFTLSDTLLTGLGTDTLSLVEQAVITGGVDANRLDASGFTLGPVTLTGAEGNDTLIGGSMDDSLDAGEGDDSLTGNAGTNLLFGGPGTNRVIETSDVHYTLTNDLLVGTTTVPGGSLTDVLSQTVQAHLSGGPSANLFHAAAFTGTVTLDGGAGNDTLQGGSASDSLIGGLDDDSLLASADVDFTLTNTLLTGLGSDTLDGFERASLTGGASANKLDAGAFTLGPVTLTGEGADDTLVGGSSDDRLEGGSGHDVFTGGDGNDLFLGGADSADLVDESVTGAGGFVLTSSLLNGRGIDTLNQIDRVQLTGGSAGNSLNAQLASVPVTLMGGPGNDTLIGGQHNDNLQGQADNDFVTGGPGRDTLDGGTGDSDALVETIDADYLSLTKLTLLAVFNGQGEPIDDALIGNSFERASLTGGALSNEIDAVSFNYPVTLVGLGGNDSLRGSSEADSLLGGDGNDTLVGFSGNNTLDAGTGNDSLLGGTGNESLQGGAGNDTLSAFAGDDIIDGGPGSLDLLVEQVSGHVVLTDSSMSGLGSDLVTRVELVQLNGGVDDDTLDASAYTAGTVTLSGGLGHDLLRGGSQADSLLGGEGDDSLTGNGGDDLLDGGAGADWAVETADGLVVLTDGGLVTGLGTDTYVGLEHASLTGGSGADTLDASAYTLSPVKLHGGDGNDSLIGTALADSLFGDGGQDALDGRQGNDSLMGGVGTDSAAAAGNVNFTVTATSLVGNGTDTLAPDVERVRLTGGTADNTFDLLAWPGLASISGLGGMDLLSVGGSLADDDFLIEAAQVIRGAITVGFSSVELLVVDGGAGQDTLTISDVLSVQAQADGAAVEASPLTEVTLLGGDGDDLIGFKPLPTIPVHVDGGDHTVGDTLRYDATNIVLSQLEGQLLPQDYQPVSYTKIEFVDLVRQFLNTVFLPFINR